jgi:hypothetical protein
VCSLLKLLNVADDSERTTKLSSWYSKQCGMLWSKSICTVSGKGADPQPDNRTRSPSNGKTLQYGHHSVLVDSAIHLNSRKRSTMGLSRKEMITSNTQGNCLRSERGGESRASLLLLLLICLPSIHWYFLSLDFRPPRCVVSIMVLSDADSRCSTRTSRRWR